MAFQKIDASRLKQKIDISLPPNDAETEAEVVKKISELMYKSSSTVILSDACAIRHRVLGELQELMERTKLPSFVSPMGKGSINETSAQFGGVYVGDASRNDVKKRIEEAELVLYIGALKSDFNSGGFTYRIETSRTVEFHSDHMKLRYSVFPGVQMNQVLRKLIDTLDYKRIRSTAPTALTNELPHHERSNVSPVITHDYFWPIVGQSLRENDVIITETGTSNFGILETRFPANVTHISQVLYGSIGYSVGALQGAALAAHEDAPDRRVVLFVGDGSLQLTVQEIATVIRHKLKPIIFVLNNNGYTIERMIHGMTAGYNDISPWKHQLLLEVFGAPEKERKSWQVKTRVELESLFEDKEFMDAGKVQLVEVFMPQDDAPRALVEIGKITAARNAGSGAANA